jgi:DNA-directed RNA polymerase subunit K/omega
METITRFEKARLISARALQLSLGAPVLIKSPTGTTMLDVAKEEFSKKVIPLSVLREYPNGEVRRVEVDLSG